MTEFVDLPDDGRGAFKQFWQDLRDNPGQWAIYPGKGRPDYRKAEGFELVSRGGQVYCRYPLTD